MIQNHAMSKSGLRVLSPGELLSVSGGNFHINNEGVDPFNPTANHSPDDFLNQWEYFMMQMGGEDWIDQDRDGMHDDYDRMNGGNDGAFHLHGSDGTIMGQNADGTFTLYDPNGTPSLQRFAWASTTQNTGGSVGAEVGSDGVQLNYSANGNTYHFVPVG